MSHARRVPTTAGSPTIRSWWHAARSYNDVFLLIVRQRTVYGLHTHGLKPRPEFRPIFSRLTRHKQGDREGAQHHC